MIGKKSEDERKNDEEEWRRKTTEEKTSGVFFFFSTKKASLPYGHYDEELTTCMFSGRGIPHEFLAENWKSP